VFVSSRFKVGVFCISRVRRLDKQDFLSCSINQMHEQELEDSLKEPSNRGTVIGIKVE
jgi:hypothetical protein